MVPYVCLVSKICLMFNMSFMFVWLSLYRVRQDNFLFYMAFHIQKRKLVCHNLYIINMSSTYVSTLVCDVSAVF
jgi:hypothetical protein